MYLYSLSVVVRWNYNGSDDEAIRDNDTTEYCVAAKNFQQAYNKVVKLALAKKNIWNDTIDGVEKTYFPVSVVDVYSSQRGEYIDG